MKINAVIESRDGGTLVLDFPRSIYDVYEKLQSVGIRKSPHQIALCDEECDDVRVKLYSEDEVGKHLLLTLNEQNSLADANMLVFMVDNAKADFRSKLEQNLLHDQYSSMQEVTDDIKQMLYAESFCNEKSAIFIIMPEENPNTFFMISLIIQQLYREILAVADENGGKLKNRCVFYCDEFGTLPKIESAEMMFSASRSRRLQIVPIIQSFSQLDKNYGKEGSEIIVDNTQITLFGGFAPNSSSAETLSKALGSRTVMTGSVSRSKNDPSQSLQMIERPLLTPDELKSLPKGDFVVMKTGVHPMRVHLKLFFKWGIEFDEKHPYSVAEHGNRKVEYAEKKGIQDGIMKKYHPQEYAELQEADKASASGGQDQAEAQRHEPQKTPPQGDSSKDKSKSGGGLKPERRDRSIREAVSEVKSDGQA